MAASSRGRHAVSALLKGSPQSCPNSTRIAPQIHLLAQSTRHYSSPATAAVEAGTEAPITSESQPQPSASPSSQYRIKSGLILTRAPLITRDLTPFEESFFLYQKRLNERLAAPFRSQLYFKKDTPGERDWRIKVGMRRGTLAKDIGLYKGKGRFAWDDEVLIGTHVGEQEQIRRRLLRDAEMRISEDGEKLGPRERAKMEKPSPRITEADEKKDLKRLDRALDQTLYLVVKDAKGWAFPTTDVLTSEALHETAARALASAAGINMNTWIVGRVPVAHIINKPISAPEGTKAGEGKGAVSKHGEKIFLLKGRIMAGQADLTGNKLGLTDFKWLTKDELATALDSYYFSKMKNMLAER